MPAIQVLGNPDTALRREIDEGHHRAGTRGATCIFLYCPAQFDVIRAQQIGGTGQEVIDLKASLVDNGREPYGTRHRHRMAPVNIFPRRHLATSRLIARLPP